MIAFFTFIALNLTAAPVDYYPEGKYINGTELLAIEQKDKPSLGWEFIEVPFEYDISTSRTVKISFKKNLNFSVTKPTILFFNGGPGGNSSEYNFGKLFPDFNFIFFNQRGALFSRPDSEADFLDPRNYSSKNTARDALEILKSLHILEATVYGHSYGTVPATMFAHLFPNHTRSVILEGTIFSGETELWNAPHRLKIVQNFFEKLTPDLQTRIIRLSEEKNPSWFANLALSYMYSEDFENRMKDHLIMLFGPPEKPIPDIYVRISLAAFKTRRASGLTETSYYSSVMFAMITCQELSGHLPESSFEASFVSGQLQNVPQGLNNCASLGISEKMHRTYSAADYPIVRPIYYFQGVLDGATVAPFAIKHYKSTPLGQATLMLAKKSGHLPLLNTIAMNDKDLEKVSVRYLSSVKDVFSKAVLAKRINPTDLSQLNETQTIQWVMTSK